MFNTVFSFFGQIFFRRKLSELSPGRWLALGGGGYNISAVIRGWARAFSVMLGNEWPNEINNPIADKYGIHFFDDPVQDSLPENIREEIKRYAERSTRKRSSRMSIMS